MFFNSFTHFYLLMLTCRTTQNPKYLKSKSGKQKITSIALSGFQIYHTDIVIKTLRQSHKARYTIKGKNHTV